MDLIELHGLAIKLEQWLRVWVHPLAIKMLKDRTEVPKDAIIPTRDWGHKYSQCQAWARSQRDGTTIAMFKEDSWCPEPVIGYGFSERIPYFLEGNLRYPGSIKDLDAASVWSKNMPCFEYGAYKGIVSAPLSTCSFLPDLIVLHINGVMASQLMIVKNWIDGKDVYAQISGHGACVYSVVPVLQKKECSIAIPCRGERKLAGSQDDDIIYSIPIDLLPNFANGIDWLQDHGLGIPIVQEYKEEYDLKPGYKKLGELLGMDMTNSPPRPQKLQKH